jgi:hypothetical protein
MPYVYTSPWQDAANLGSGIGDRLAEALINLPLKRQAVVQQLLEQKVALAQRQQQFGLEQQRIAEQRQHYGAEQEHWLRQDTTGAKRVQSAEELGKEKAHAEYIQNTTHNELERQRLDETARHNKVDEGNTGARIAIEHAKIGPKALNEPRAEFHGRSALQISKMKDEDIAELPPDVQAAWKEYYTHIESNAKQKQQGGQVQIPAREIPGKDMGSALQPPGQRQGGPSWNTGSTQTPKVSSDAERDALPPGTQYLDSQGNVRMKQGGAAQPKPQPQSIGAALTPKPQQQSNPPETWQHDEYAQYVKQRNQQAATQRQQQSAAGAITAQRQAHSDETVTSSEELDKAAQALRYGGLDDPTVVQYLAQFTPQQRAVQLRVLQERAESFRNQQ